MQAVQVEERLATMQAMQVMRKMWEMRVNQTKNKAIGDAGDAVNPHL